MLARGKKNTRLRASPRKKDTEAKRNSNKDYHQGHDFLEEGVMIGPRPGGVSVLRTGVTGGPPFWLALLDYTVTNFLQAQGL